MFYINVFSKYLYKNVEVFSLTQLKSWKSQNNVFKMNLHQLKRVRRLTGNKKKTKDIHSSTKKLAFKHYIQALGGKCIQALGEFEPL